MSGPKRNKNELERMQAIHIYRTFQVAPRGVCCFTHMPPVGRQTENSWKWRWVILLSLKTATFTLHILPQKPAPAFIFFFIFSCLCKCVSERAREIAFSPHGKISKWAPWCPSFHSLSVWDINYGCFSQGFRVKEKGDLLTQLIRLESVTALTWWIHPRDRRECIKCITSPEKFPHTDSMHMWLVFIFSPHPLHMYKSQTVHSI